MSTKKKIMPPKAEEPTVTDQDLKWDAALCAVRNTLWNLNSQISLIANECRTVGVADDHIWDESALRTFVRGLVDRLNASNDCTAELMNAVDRFLGCRFMADVHWMRSKRENENLIHHNQERELMYLSEKAKKLGYKLVIAK